MAGAREVARRFALRIRTQAVLLSVVPLSFLVLLCVVATALQQKTDETAMLSQRSTGALAESEAIRKVFERANVSIVEYTRTGRAESLAGYRAARGDLGKHEQSLERLVQGEPAQGVRAKRYVALSDRAFGVVAQYVALWQKGKKAEALALVTVARKHVAVDYFQAQADFDLTERKTMLDRYAALHRDVQSLGALLLGGSFLGIVLTLFVTGQFGLRIARRLLRLADNARRMGRGEPTPVIEGGDEIADLDRVYHEMTARIQETLHQREEALAAYERAHHVASTLQRALLPQDLPSIPGVAFDGVYVPGRSEAQVGGDWYDALRLADGRVLITIGDVAGSG